LLCGARVRCGADAACLSGRQPFVCRL
jgi:hypothetical protein